MSDNHRRDRGSQQRSPQGSDHADHILDDLALTVPQARPAFQKALETQLVAVLQEKQRHIKKRSDLPMRVSAHNPNYVSSRQQRTRNQWPLTLVAALAVFLAVGALLMMMNQMPPGDEPEPAFGVAGQDHQATETSLRATLNALETQSAEMARRVTIEQTLIAVEQAQTSLAATSPAPVGTTMPAALDLCLLEPVTVYSAPDASSAVLAEIVPDASHEIQGTLALNPTGEEWFLIGFAGANGDLMRGWVQADVMRAACRPESVSGVPLPASVMPTVLPPTQTITASPMFTPTFTVTPTITATATHTVTPTIVPTQAAPVAAGENSVATVQVRVADAETIDQAMYVGQTVDVLIAVGSEDDPVIIPVARGVTVLDFLNVPMPNETRYHFVDALILPRNTEQAELLAGLAETGIEMKLVLVE